MCATSAIEEEKVDPQEQSYHNMSQEETKQPYKEVSKKTGRVWSKEAKAMVKKLTSGKYFDFILEMRELMKAEGFVFTGQKSKKVDKNAVIAFQKKNHKYASYYPKDLLTIQQVYNYSLSNAI